MKYKYQLILIGENEEFFKALEIELRRGFDELKILSDALKIIREQEVETEYSGGQPAFVIYAGHKNNITGRQLEILKNQKLDGNIILPVFNKSFSEEIHEFLSNQNALTFHNNITKIKNIVLEGFELLRKNRKLFISYKRAESSNIAIQLYEFLERNNFDVFIDTHSIDKGDEFQEELWHRMTDCDLILMLNTKGFLDSEWCKQELDKAHLKRIGIVHLLWPDCDFADFAHIAHSLKLQYENFENSNVADVTKGILKENILPEILNLVESSRARNLASRQDWLITDFTQAANDNDAEVNLQFSRYITQKLENGKIKVFIPTVGIPQSINCHNSQKLIKQIEDKEIESITLIFDELSIRNYWLEHLDWLNEYLEIKTLKKSQFNKAFSK
ncbi:toll/interleukin-1 receptor domain-containing protein [Empedobacter falsenii]|uniref:Toll/interleukin-1 receptor domain-containing protein n=1 Tax=Empedobacter falsenii TaxID=343874 RepID=A0A3R8SPT3_9FLAO|nr:toll/interleukin-1 receptor domain-containing protein [Empedobacter falsenii]RRT86401.1 toll/interleukin-1 receptor domain-containing protein [Empedobacter falsenii]RRT87465.1 toll/interleukin-1 receptor domain-containing protein [Empedobacter falsenii]